MPICDFKKTRARWSFVSKIDTLGSLDFWTLTVSLDSLSPSDTRQLSMDDLLVADTLSMEDYERHSKVLPLAVHEYTHFVDATSTVWGLRHLEMLNKCHDVPVHDEFQFYILKNTYDYIRQIRLPDYYTAVEKNVGSGTPWTSNITSGVMFNADGSVGDRPIIFVRFWNSNKEPIVRSPISLVSLLEASAMEREIDCRAKLLRRLKGDERLVEEKLMTQDVLKYIYNPKLTEYSVCFHLLANLQDEKDLATISIYVGILSRMVLNAPTIAFSTMLKNIGAYANRYKLDDNHPSLRRMKKSIEMNSRGAFFYLICLFLPKYALKNQATFFRSVDASLKQFGLSLDKLRRGACAEMQELKSRLSLSSNQSIRELAKAGLHNFQIVYPNQLSYPLEKLALPPALLGDLTKFNFSKTEENILKDYDLDIGYDNLIPGQIRSENFAEACR